MSHLVTRSSHGNSAGSHATLSPLESFFRIAVLDSDTETIVDEPIAPLQLKISHCQLPLVGLEHVFEVNCEQVSSDARSVPFSEEMTLCVQVPSWRAYFCKLCAHMSNETNFLDHLLGFAHQMEFLERWEPAEALKLRHGSKCDRELQACSMLT